MTRALGWGLALAVLLGPACKAEGPRVLSGSEAPISLGAPIRDPVDGANCARTPETESAVFEGRNYYFCSDEARRRFAEDPARFAYD